MRSSALLTFVALGAFLAGCDPGDEGAKVMEDFKRPANSAVENPPMNPPETDTGSGLGTASGAGTAPNPTSTAQ